jgi:ADP-ribose pyrophosphatase
MEVGVERVALPDGRIVDDFLWVKTRDFAMAVAITRDGRVFLERSYKHGPGRVALSLPAGYVEAGEMPEETARRELREETGYTSDEWRPLGSFTVDGNYGVCVEHVFSRVERTGTSDAGAVGHDDLEEIEVLTLQLDEALSALARGEIDPPSSATRLSFAAVWSSAQ